MVIGVVLDAGYKTRDTWCCRLDTRRLFVDNNARDDPVVKSRETHVHSGAQSYCECCGWLRPGQHMNIVARVRPYLRTEPLAIGRVRPFHNN